MQHHPSTPRLLVLALSALVVTACADTAEVVAPDEAPAFAGAKGKPTFIGACGYVITDPGKYIVASDLTNCPGTGIAVRSSGVSLHLDGHVVDGTGSGAGIHVRTVDDVRILGPGTVQGFGTGVGFLGVAGSSMNNVTVTGNGQGFAYNRDFGGTGRRSSGNQFNDNSFLDNTFHGVTINGGDGGTFRGNRSEGNGQGGYLIFNGSGNDFRGNEARGNGTGFAATTNASGNTIQGNTSLGNGLDMSDQHGHCGANTWKGNTFDTANPACID